MSASFLSAFSTNTLPQGPISSVEASEQTFVVVLVCGWLVAGLAWRHQQVIQVAEQLGSALRDCYACLCPRYDHQVGAEANEQEVGIPVLPGAMGQ